MAAEFSDDAALGGKLVLRQPRRGHRFGHDAILLAAATAARAGEHAVDLGSGIGAAGLALARRVEGLVVTLVEIDPALSALGRDNAERNGLVTARACGLSRCRGDVRGFCRSRTAGFFGRSRADEPALQCGAKSVAGSRPPPGAHRVARYARAMARRRRALTARIRDGHADLARRRPGRGVAGAGSGFRRGCRCCLFSRNPTLRRSASLCGQRKARSGQLARLPGFVLASADGKPSGQAEAVLREGATLDWSGT